VTTAFNIRDFGAIGDGVTNDAVAIQCAIDAANGNGGGTVLVPAGATFLSGSLVLKSNVELHIERGATLQCSGDWEDITERVMVGSLSAGIITDQTEQTGTFLAAYGAENVAITGAGTIDGGGRLYVIEDLGPIYSMPGSRPFTVFFRDCTNVTVAQTLYRDPALWTVRLTGCAGVLVHAIRIAADMKMPGADGIVIDRCRDVRISDCSITCPDDAIALKTCGEFPDSGPCENVTVTNCVIETKSGALVAGVDATAPIRNVVFSNCVVSNSGRGLSVNLGQDGVCENILFSDIVVEARVCDDSWWGRGEPIYVSAFPWQEGIGRIRNVRFVNILARGESGIHISASEPGLIDGLLLDTVRVEVDHCSEDSGHPMSGIHVDNATNVVLRDCEVAPRSISLERSRARSR
jgi:polygalacturonase